MDINKIIIAEDDEDLLENIIEYLELEEFNVTGVTTALDFFQALSISVYDIAVIDIGLPDRSGYELVEHLRNNTSLGIIIITARDTINDKMRGYDAGADYYFIKPVDSRELSATINNLLIRLKKHTSGHMIPQHDNEWLLHSRNWVLISPAGEKIKLTTKEMSFLQIIFDEDGTPVLRENVLSSLEYGNEGPYGNRALDVMLVRLRKKIKSETNSDDLPFKTVHSVGFVLATEGRQI